ncbi:hypothetical protein D9M69_710780 [compost metagenome]
MGRKEFEASRVDGVHAQLARMAGSGKVAFASGSSQANWPKNRCSAAASACCWAAACGCMSTPATAAASPWKAWR